MLSLLILKPKQILCQGQSLGERVATCVSKRQKHVSDLIFIFQFSFCFQTQSSASKTALQGFDFAFLLLLPISHTLGRDLSVDSL